MRKAFSREDDAWLNLNEYAAARLGRWEWLTASTVKVQKGKCIWTSQLERGWNGEKWLPGGECCKADELCHGWDWGSSLFCGQCIFTAATVSPWVTGAGRADLCRRWQYAQPAVWRYHSSSSSLLLLLLRINKGTKVKWLGHWAHWLIALAPSPSLSFHFYLYVCVCVCACTFTKVELKVQSLLPIRHWGWHPH